MMKLPMLTTLDVRLTKRSMFPKGSKAAEPDEHGRIPALYNVSIRNMGDDAVRIIGKKWTVYSPGEGVQVLESDELFATRPLLCKGQIFAFNGLQMLRKPGRLCLSLLVRDEAGVVYYTDPVSITW